MARILYPDDFVWRVKELFPELVSLHRHLERNSIWVGCDLTEALNEGLSPETILEYLNSEKVLDLKTIALNAIDKKSKINKLLKEWEGYL